MEKTSWARARVLDLTQSEGGPKLSVESSPRRRRSVEWKLRAQDWNAPVMAFDKVSASLDNVSSTAVFKAVVLCDEDQLEVLLSLLLGCGKQHGVICGSRLRP